MNDAPNKIDDASLIDAMADEIEAHEKEVERLRTVNAKLMAACNHSKSVLIQVSEQQGGLIADHGDCLDELIVAIRDAESA